MLVLVLVLCVRRTFSERELGHVYLVPKFLVNRFRPCQVAIEACNLVRRVEVTYPLGDIQRLGKAELVEGDEPVAPYGCEGVAVALAKVCHVQARPYVVVAEVWRLEREVLEAD